MGEADGLVNLSAIIMELEALARDYETRATSRVITREQMADELERLAEHLFRLAARVRYGKE